MKATHLIYSAIALSIFSQGNNIYSSLEKGNELRQEQADFNNHIRTARQREKEAIALSKIAIGRYQHCILVTDLETKQPTYFYPGQEVLDRKRNQTLRPGAAVCNELGDTAIVAPDGTLLDIARVGTTDMNEFKKLLRRRQNASY